MAAAIEAENISKAYRLGEIGTGTLSQDLHRWYAKLKGKEDPFLKIGETNDRTIKGDSNVVWSLKDINFEIQEGDAVGIIGRNGAGKSTLLKILSRVTAPTTGLIKARGRIASLLEVGTGFHPELSGRDNIYLNGAILGMRKKEISRRFDEIVDFSGVERYIDTPVKRYSSGMYVRLAFAVAAHLESEILIVDEVLAVGDAEFQKKCLGKMNEVSSNQGRTVLFVSHDMSSIQFFCKKSILLKNGYVQNFNASEKIIQEYLSDRKSGKKRTGSGEIKILDVEILNNLKETVSQITLNQPYLFKVTLQALQYMSNISFALCFNNINKVRACSLWTSFNGISYDVDIGKYILIFEVQKLQLTPGLYELITYIECKGSIVEQIDEFMDMIVINETNGSKNSIKPNLSTGVYIENFTSYINRAND